MSGTDQTLNYLSYVREISFYLLVGVLFFAAISLPIYFYPDPDLSPPEPLPDQSQGINSSSATQQPTTTQPTQEVFVDPPQNRGLPNVAPLFGLIAVILLFIGILSLVKRRGLTTMLSTQTEDVKVSKLKFSRDQARDILINARKSGDYTLAVIEAYQALDSALDNFREVARPKHWTPKEYAFSVRDPVFPPSVYRIISIFYEVRYGLNQATRENVETFLVYLDRLLVKENSKQEQELETEKFDLTKQLWNQFEIPIKGDLTKP